MGLEDGFWRGDVLRRVDSLVEDYAVREVDLPVSDLRRLGDSLRRAAQVFNNYKVSSCAVVLNGRGDVLVGRRVSSGKETVLFGGKPERGGRFGVRFA